MSFYQNQCKQAAASRPYNTVNNFKDLEKGEIGGKFDDKLETAKNFLSKSIEVSSVIKDGNFVDVGAINEDHLLFL